MEGTKTADARAYYIARFHSNRVYDQDPPFFPGTRNISTYPGFQNTPAPAGANSQRHGQHPAGNPVVYNQPQPVNLIVTPPVKSYMGFAIFATICCCCPVGVFAIMRACQVNSALRANDIGTARIMSEKSKRLSEWSIAIGIIFGGILILSIIIVNAN